ncbi:MAG TPA: hypothetical protein VHE35_23190 [Kofleriaceae bacterium]|nr:hypothetical protein [Kofleriaceae bacterium]
MKPRSVPRPPPALVGLLLATGALAAICGLAMLVSNGRWLGLSLSLLDPSPFASYRVPGLLLAFVVGGSQLAAGRAVVRRRPGHLRLAVIAAVLLAGWIAIQALMIGIVWLQPVVFVVALVELGLVAATIPREEPPAPGGRAARVRRRGHR